MELCLVIIDRVFLVPINIVSKVRLYCDLCLIKSKVSKLIEC